MDRKEGSGPTEVGERRRATVAGDEQAHHRGLVQASESRSGDQETSKHAILRFSIQEVFMGWGPAGQGIGGNNETRTMIPTLQLGQRAAGSTIRATNEAI